MSRRIRPVPAVIGALLAVFVVARAFILARGETFTSYDTFSYAYRNDPVWDRGPLVSFTGHAPRSWGVPLFYSLFGDDHARVVGQWAVATLAWAFLAWALSCHLRRPAGRIVAAAGVLAVGLLLPVTNWDFAVLSESLSISLGVLALGLFLQWWRTSSPWWLAGMTVVVVWWTYTRLDMFPLALPFAAALAWFAWRRRGEPAGRRWATVAAALVIVLSAAWSYAIAPVTIHTLERWSFAPDLDHEHGLQMYRLRISVFADPEVKAVFESELGMPKCPGADRVAARSDWAVEEFAAEAMKCPEFKAWSDANLQGLWSRYAAAAPGLFARQIAGYTSDSLIGATYASVPSVYPGLAERLAFPRRSALPITLGALAICFALAIALSRRSRGGLIVAAATIAATSLASVVLTVIVSAGEFWRFGMQEAVGVRIAAVILLACAADSLVRRRPPGAATTPAAPAEAVSAVTVT